MSEELRLARSHRGAHRPAFAAGDGADVSAGAHQGVALMPELLSLSARDGSGYAVGVAGQPRLVVALNVAMRLGVWAAALGQHLDTLWVPIAVAWAVRIVVVERWHPWAVLPPERVRWRGPSKNPDDYSYDTFLTTH